MSEENKSEKNNSRIKHWCDFADFSIDSFFMTTSIMLSLR